MSEIDSTVPSEVIEHSISPEKGGRPPRLRVSSSPVNTVLLALIALGIGLSVHNGIELQKKAGEILDQALAAAHERWEYDVVTISGAGYNRLTSPESFYADWIAPSVETLDEMGRQGWELAGCYLEMETAFPNFGNEDYVTGIRDNIRPQRLVLIFKRRTS